MKNVLFFILFLAPMIILIGCEYETVYTIEVINQLDVPVDIYVDGEYKGVAEPIKNNLISLSIEVGPGIHDLEARARGYKMEPQRYEKLDVKRNIRWIIESKEGKGDDEI